MAWRGLLLGLALLAAFGRPALAQQQARISAGEELRIAVPGTEEQLVTRLCRPPGTAPARLVVINHGSPRDAAQRPGMRPIPCGAEPVRWFTTRGFVVLQPMRRGYGTTGGRWAEHYSGCAEPDFVRAGRESARDIAAAVAAGRALPGVRPDGVLVVGQSAGGWASIALAAAPPEGVVALVNFSGGRAGWAGGQPNTVCRRDRLEQAAGVFGATARLPMLWVYTANDSYFPPDLPEALHAAFTAAGGRAELVRLGAFGEDGHRLFPSRGGSAVWGPVLEAWLARLR
jgi:dienelactone hydrolase